MFKNNKGITIVSLVVMIIVILILLAVGLTTGLELLRDTKMKRSITTMLLINSVASGIKESYDFDESNELVGTLVDAGSEDLNISGIVDRTDWYKWGIDELEEYGIRTDMVTLKNEAYFLVKYGVEPDDPYVIDIVYSQGVEEVSGDRIWSLRRMLISQNLE